MAEGRAGDGEIADARVAGQPDAVAAVILKEAVGDGQAGNRGQVVDFEAAGGVVEKANVLEGHVGDAAAVFPDANAPDGYGVLCRRVADSQVAHGHVAGADLQHAVAAAGQPLDRRVIGQDGCRRAVAVERQGLVNDDVLVARAGVGSGGDVDSIAGDGLGHAIGEGEAGAGDVGTVAGVDPDRTDVAVARREHRRAME